MAAQNFPDPILAFTLTEEGKLENNPADPAGITYAGIPLRSYRNLMHNQALTVVDLEAITPGAEAAFYRAGYWVTIDGDNLPSGVDAIVFDFGVNTGPGTSERILQRAVRVAEDGVIGPITLAAVKSKSPANLIVAISGWQKAYYRALSTFPVFGAGWIARTEARTTLALKLIPTTKETT